MFLTADRTSPVLQRAALHLKNDTNLLQRSAVVSDSPRVRVKSSYPGALDF